MAIDHTGQLFVWGYCENSKGLFKENDYLQYPTEVQEFKNVVDCDCGEAFSIVIVNQLKKKILFSVQEKTRKLQIAKEIKNKAQQLSGYIIEKDTSEGSPLYGGLGKLSKPDWNLSLIHI
eukprot:TRINITY_DN30062_c0_g1_i1.p4 TRINITY_DN30062_c0_g1~~TRINITY_DN30062_c0_g1_i1.p4  ORF type:complete len:120 (+),score=21.08 TRINITY_DN30062_c0_g1_i1:564-923(+)